MNIIKKINSFNGIYSTYNLTLDLKKSTIEQFLFSDNLRFRHFEIKKYQDDIIMAINKIDELFKNLLNLESKLDMNIKIFLADCHLKYNELYQNNLNNTVFCENFYESYFRFLSILKKIDNEVFGYEVEDFEFFEIDPMDDIPIDATNYWNEKLKF